MKFSALPPYKQPRRPKAKAKTDKMGNEYFGGFRKDSGIFYQGAGTAYKDPIVKQVKTNKFNYNHFGTTDKKLDNYVKKLKKDIRKKNTKVKKENSEEAVQKKIALLRKKVKYQLDPEYNPDNFYTKGQFKDMMLPRADFTLAAGPAHEGLAKAWIAFKIFNRQGNTEAATEYAKAIQKFRYLLEEPVPPFRDFGLENFGPTFKKNMKDQIYTFETDFDSTRKNIEFEV